MKSRCNVELQKKPHCYSDGRKQYTCNAKVAGYYLTVGPLSSMLYLSVGSNCEVLFLDCLQWPMLYPATLKSKYELQ